MQQRAICRDQFDALGRGFHNRPKTFFTLSQRLLDPFLLRDIIVGFQSAPRISIRFPIEHPAAVDYDFRAVFPFVN